MGYKLEIWMRWGFLAALVAVMAVSFYGSPFNNLAAKIYGEREARGPRCRIQVSRDFEHTAAIGIPAIQSMARFVHGINFSNPVALEACRRDPSLKAVYIRQNCDGYGFGQLSKTVYCP